MLERKLQRAIAHLSKNLVIIHLSALDAGPARRGFILIMMMMMAKTNMAAHMADVVGGEYKLFRGQNQVYLTFIMV